MDFPSPEKNHKPLLIHLGSRERKEWSLHSITGEAASPVTGWTWHPSCPISLAGVIENNGWAPIFMKQGERLSLLPSSKLRASSWQILLSIFTVICFQSRKPADSESKRHNAFLTEHHAHVPPICGKRLCYQILEHLQVCYPGKAGSWNPFTSLASVCLFGFGLVL